MVFFLKGLVCYQGVLSHLCACLAGSLEADKTRRVSTAAHYRKSWPIRRPICRRFHCKTDVIHIELFLCWQLIRVNDSFLLLQWPDRLEKHLGKIFFIIHGPHHNSSQGVATFFIFFTAILKAVIHLKHYWEINRPYIVFTDCTSVICTTGVHETHAVCLTGQVKRKVI